MARQADGAASARSAGRIFTIPPASPFLDTLAMAILKGDVPRLEGRAPSPLELADTIIYVPNRAACRELRSAFLRAAPSGATLLPRIRPLGGADEDALLILHAAEDDDPSHGLPIPPAQRADQCIQVQPPPAVAGWGRCREIG